MIKLVNLMVIVKVIKSTPEENEIKYTQPSSQHSSSRGSKPPHHQYIFIFQTLTFSFTNSLLFKIGTSATLLIVCSLLQHNTSCLHLSSRKSSLLSLSIILDVCYYFFDCLLVFSNTGFVRSLIYSSVFK